MEVASVKASTTSAKVYITLMEASMEIFVQVTSMEAMLEIFVEAPMGITLVEAFIFSIYSMKHIV